jgi:hypothetical protein
VGGAVSYAVARAEHSDAVAEPVQATAADRQRGAQTLASVSTALVLTGAALAAIGVGWKLVTWRSSAPAARAATLGVGVGVASAALEGRF